MRKIGALVMAALPLAAAPGFAQDGAERQLAQARQSGFNIPAQSLAGALTAFGQQSGMQVSVDGGLVRGVDSPGVSGTMAPEQALARLLAGTGFAYRLIGGNTVTLQRLPQSGAAMTLDPISVRGDQPTADPGRTEGSTAYTGSHVSVGSKTPTTLREIPHSVSVVTRQRMDDQNINTLQDAMKQTTGMTVQRYDGAGYFNEIYTRGYQADSIMLDGLPLSSHGNLATSMDTAMYDRIEVLRGPAGLFQGAGEPGASINMARKRAGKSFALGGEASTGSWDMYRGEADLTVPLVESGRLRARLVGAVDDRSSFIDVVESNKKLGYGTLELDVTPDTTLSIGAARQDIDAVLDQGLPAYADGRLADVKRSTFTGANWNQQDMRSNDYFAEMQHRFENGGHLQASGRYFDRRMLYRGARANSAIDPATGNFTVATTLYDLSRETTMLDAHGATPFEAFGQRHNIVVGTDYRVHEDRGDFGGAGAVYTSNIFTPNHDFANPSIPVTGSSEARQEQIGLYGKLTIKPVDWGSIILGGRMSWYDVENRNLLTGQVTSAYSIEGEGTPYAGVVIDLSDALSLYGSYASIFQPQSQRDSAGQFLAPRTGDQHEIGIKGEFFNGRLNGHLAAYRIEDQNRAMTDPNDATASIAAGKVRSQGAEAEVSGRPLPGLDLVAGYAFSNTKYLAAAATSLGQTYATFTPAHSINLWGKYSFPEGAGMLRGFSLGAGLKMVSRFYAQSGNVRFTENGYQTVTAQLGYSFHENLRATFTVSNLFDQEYYEKVSGASRQNFYGEPRAFVLAVSAKW